ncbi:unnamed protein product [Hydatigera taeniaeformis]|uniref:Uncharacterized protein n=1 Tax=Hydatigena taeniaeformis TaxID=6205 RepID=A0A0R3WSC3_HYDTA|nr:unnamed protein product [Hydatigera taeniaeformis]
MLASSSSDDELDDRQQSPLGAPTVHATGCGGDGSVGRGSRGVSGRAAPVAHPTVPSQIIRKSQSPQQQQQCQPNGARCSKTRHQIFSSTLSRSSVRSNDACDSGKHRLVILFVNRIAMSFFVEVVCHISNFHRNFFHLLLVVMNQTVCLLNSFCNTGFCTSFSLSDVFDQ